jgi:spermidine synthase
MFSGNTSHGGQLVIDGRGSPQALSYYHEAGPVGDVFGRLTSRPGTLDVGVIGLGVGSTAGFGRNGDVFTFYEIDPAVEALASDENLFTLLAQSPAEVTVVIEDGRLALERLRPTHDLLMVDAFTSDSIPVHLLTKEAFEAYLDSLADQGRVMVHLSNRHLDLAPVVGRIASELGASARVKWFAPGPEDTGAAASIWMLVEPAGSERLELESDWAEAPIGPSLWTDEYSNILSVLHWR